MVCFIWTKERKRKMEGERGSSSPSGAVSMQPPPPRSSAQGGFKAPPARIAPKSKLNDPKGKAKIEEDEDAPVVVESIDESSDHRQREEDDTKDDEEAPPPAPAPSPAVGEYVVPEWAARPKHAYALEVVKGGVQVERFDVSAKDHFVVGRAEGCDLVLLHPSISRRHAVIQHRAGRTITNNDNAHNDDDDVSNDDDDDAVDGGGVFVYDLGSTHGTFVGKRRVGARQYCELRVGDMVRFGASTRMFVLTAPDQESVRQEEERRLVRRKRAAEERRRYPEHHRQQQLAALRRAGGGGDGDGDDDDDDDGCGWGMGDDAQEEEEMEEEMERMDHPIGDAEDLFQGTTADAKAFMKRHRQEEREKKLQKLRRKGKKGQKELLEQQKAAEEAAAAKKLKKEQEEELANDKVEEAKLREEERLRRAVVEQWDESFDDADDFYDRAGRTSTSPSCARAVVCVAREKLMVCTHFLLLLLLLRLWWASQVHRAKDVAAELLDARRRSTASRPSSR